MLLSVAPCSLWAQTVNSENGSLSIAAPFGIEIGKTTCRQAAIVLKVKNPNHLRDLDSVPASLQLKPEGYPGVGLFSMSCQRGGNTPVTSASLTIFGSAEQYDTVISDLESKYKKEGPREIGGMAGLELQASNGNIMVYSQNTYQPAPKELLIRITYNSFFALEMYKELEKKRKDEARSKESVRRNAL